MAKEFEIKMERFDGGMSDDPRLQDASQADLISNFDIFNQPKRLKPVRSMVDDTNDGSTDDGMKQYNIQSFGVMNGVNNIYGLGTKSDGTGYKLFKKTNITGASWTALSGALCEGSDTVWPGLLQPSVGSDQFLYFLAGDKFRALNYNAGSEYVNPSYDFSDTTTSVTEGVIAKDQNSYIGRNNSIYLVTPPGDSKTFTVTIASPGVFTSTAHGLTAGSRVRFTTTGALPTGLAADTEYFVISTGLTVDAFEISATKGGTAINTSGSQSGTHTLYKPPVLTNQISIPETHEISSIDNYQLYLGFATRPIENAVAVSTKSPQTDADDDSAGSDFWLNPDNIQSNDTSFATIASIPDSDNLVAYWKLDESSGDRSDSLGNYDLTDNNTVASATGKIGNAASFTSVNSERLTSTAFTHDLGCKGTQDTVLIFSMWFKSTSIVSGSKTFFHIGGATNNSQSISLKINASGALVAEVDWQNAIGEGKSKSLTGTVTGLDDDTWHHAVFMIGYDQGGSSAALFMHLFVDDVDSGSAEDDSNQFNFERQTWKYLTLGAAFLGSSSFDDYYDGVIDELSIYQYSSAIDDLSDYYSKADGLYNTGDGVTYTTTSHYLQASNFGFAIPSGVTINGIQVEIEKKATGTVIDHMVKIIKADGSYGSTNKAKGSSWDTNEGYVSYGDALDLWGETWTDVDINDADFGVAIQANVSLEGAAFINHIRITVYYTSAPASYPNLSSYYYLWDLSSTDIYETTDMGPGKLNVTENIGGIILGVTEEYLADTFGNDKGKIVIRGWSGGEAQILKTIPALASGGSLAKWKHIKGGHIYFYAKILNDVNASTYREGIWAFGRKDAQSPLALSLEYDTTQFASSIQGFRFIGNFLLVAHSTDGSISRSDDSETYSYTSIYQSQIFEKDYENQITSVELTTEALPSGATATVKIKQNAETAWTTLFTMNTANATYDLRSRLASGEDFAKFHTVQFRMESTGGAVPVKLRARYITLNDEANEE